MHQDIERNLPFDLDFSLNFQQSLTTESFIVFVEYPSINCFMLVGRVVYFGHESKVKLFL
jgi:hypothetical protein